MKIRKIDDFKIYTMIALISAGLFFVYALFNGSKAYEWIVMENSAKYQFYDYFMHVRLSADPTHVYSNVQNASQGCFPPLSYLLYSFLFKLTAQNGVGIPEKIEDVGKIAYAMPVLVCYSIMSVILFFSALKMWIKSYNKCLLLFLSLFFSPAFFEGAIERGNSTFLIASLILISLKLRESDKKIEREIALILIAICFGFKLYPAILGVLYVKEKRIKEAVRLSIYGLCVFAAPFTVFGGIDGFVQWFKNVTTVLGRVDYGRVQYIRGLISTICKYLFNRNFEKLEVVIPLIFLVVMIIMAFASKSKIRSIIFLCSAMTFFPNNAYRYTLCYCAIPFIIYFSLVFDDGDVFNKEEKIESTMWHISTLIYAGLFSIPMVFGYVLNFRLAFVDNVLTCVEFWMYFMAYMLLAFHFIWEVLEQIKSVKMKRLSIKESDTHCN